MKTKILFGIIIALLASSLPGFAQENTAKSGEESKLAFVIEPVKTVYTRGENVEFSFRLSNRSRDKILVARSFQLNLYVNLDMTDPAGKSADWCGRILGQIDSPRSFITLSPGESLSKKLVVSCVNKADKSRAWGYSLDTPGKYMVRGTYRLPQPKVFFKKDFPDVPVVRGPVLAQPVTVEIR